MRYREERGEGGEEERRRGIGGGKGGGGRRSARGVKRRLEVYITHMYTHSHTTKRLTHSHTPPSAFLFPHLSASPASRVDVSLISSKADCSSDSLRSHESARSDADKINRLIMGEKIMNITNKCQF
jgi:hypothetical protein